MHRIGFGDMVLNRKKPAQNNLAKLTSLWEGGVYMGIRTVRGGNCWYVGGRLDDPHGAAQAAGGEMGLERGGPLDVPGADGPPVSFEFGGG